MLIGWTTVASRPQADSLARGLIEARLAACAQIDGPIASIYRWEGKVEETAEYRLTLKFLAAQHRPLEAWLHRHHPYESPEWVVVAAEYVAEKYLSWAQANANSFPFSESVDPL